MSTVTKETRMELIDFVLAEMFILAFIEILFG